MGYFPCHLCAKFEENVSFFVFVLVLFLQKWLLLLCLLIGIELILMVSSFEVIMESVWPWRSEAPWTSEKGSRACWFLMNNSNVRGGRHKLCSNYPNTWPGGDLLWEDADFFICLVHG